MSACRPQEYTKDCVMESWLSYGLNLPHSLPYPSLWTDTTTLMQLHFCWTKKNKPQNTREIQRSGFLLHCTFSAKCWHAFALCFYMISAKCSSQRGAII